VICSAWAEPSSAQKNTAMTAAERLMAAPSA
jgi:hypothetical protein